MDSFSLLDSSPMIQYDHAWTPSFTAGTDGYDRSVHIGDAGTRAGFSFNITASAITFNIDLPSSSSNPCTAVVRLNSSTPTSACPTASSPFTLTGLPAGQHFVEYSTQPFGQPSTTITTTNSSTSPARGSSDVRFWGITATRPALDMHQWQWHNVTFDDAYLISAGGRDGFAYSLDGAWVMEKGKGAAGAADAVQVTQSVTDKEGAEVSFTGQGAGMYLYGRVGPEYGTVRVEVEGEGGGLGWISTLDLTSPWPSASQLLYFTTGLDPSVPHTVRMHNLEDKRFSVDRMVVTQMSNSGGSGFISTAHGKIVFFVVIPLLALCLLIFGLCVFFPSLRKVGCLSRKRRDHHDDMSDPSGVGAGLEKGFKGITSDSFKSGEERERVPVRSRWGEGFTLGSGRKKGQDKRICNGEVDRKGSQAALRPYWMEEDAYSFKELSSAGISAGAARSGLNSPTSLTSPLDRPARGRNRLRDRPSSSTLSRLMFIHSSRGASNLDSDAMSTKTGRTDRTRDLVIPYEAGRAGGMLASPKMGTRTRTRGQTDQEEGEGEREGEGEGVQGAAMRNEAVAAERKAFRQPKPSKSTDTFGTDRVLGAGKGKSAKTGAEYDTPPTTSSLPSPSFQPVRQDQADDPSSHHRSASRQSRRAIDHDARASSASWATLMRPINALLSKRGSSGTASAFSSLPSPGLPTFTTHSSAGATNTNTATITAPTSAPKLTHLQIPTRAVNNTHTNDREPSPMTGAGSEASSYPFTPASTSQYTEARIQQYSRATKQGARYVSKMPEEAGLARAPGVGLAGGESPEAQESDVGDYGDYAGGKPGAGGRPGNGTGCAAESSRGDSGYRFQSSLPSDLSPTSPLPTASSASRYSDALGPTSARPDQLTTARSSSTYRMSPRMHRQKLSSRDLPPAHPFAAANQRNRYSASSSVDVPADAGADAGAYPYSDADADADAISTRGAPPSMRLSIKSTWTARSDLAGLSPDFFPWHLRRESGSTIQAQAGPVSPVGTMQDGHAPSSWRHSPSAVQAPRRGSTARAPVRVGVDELGASGEDDDPVDRLPTILYS